MKSFYRQSNNARNYEITHDIRNLFPDMELLPTPEELINKVHLEQYLEKTEDVYRLNLISTENAIDDVSYILKLEDSNLKGIAWSCLGGIYTFNGNYQKAFAAFNLSLDYSNSGDVKAFTYTEISNLLRQLGYVKESVSVLQNALTMTANERLIWRIKTYIGLCSKYKDPELSLSVLKRSVDYYQTKKDYVRLTNVLRHIGTVYIFKEQLNAAKQYLDKAMEISVDHSLKQYKFDILNDKGWLWIQMKKYDLARDIFNKLIMNNLPPYQMSLALQNLGYIEYECGHFREAISYHTQSLRLTTQYEMRNMAFEDYYKLGICHEKIGELGLAEHFYSMGYSELENEIEIGLRLMGYRKKLLDSYISFLRKNQKVPYIDLKGEIFSFAMNKTLKEIKEIFHKNLFNHHLEHTKNAPQLCEKLGIDKRTYFLYQKRLGLKRGQIETGSSEVNQYFTEYLQSLDTFRWREVNQRFEQDLYEYLLSKYQYNKKKLAEGLGVSYQLVIQKTR